MKPPYWHPDFGNDWLTNINEVDITAIETLPLIPSSLAEIPLGFVLVATLLVCSFLLLVVKRIEAWRAMAFQRDALKVLNLVEQNYKQGDRKALTRLNKILKQSAMHLPEGRDIASLSGDSWQAGFMTIQISWSANRTKLSASDIAQYEQWAYQPINNDMPIESGLRFINRLKGWLTSLVFIESPDKETIT